MALVIWHVQDAGGDPLAGAVVEGLGDTLGYWQGVTNACGDLVTELGADHYLVTVTHPAAQARELPAVIADCGTITVGLEPAPPPPVAPIQPVVCDGPIFRVAATGDPWRWQFVTAFKALQRWCDGEDLEPFVRWTHDVGARGWRVFCQHAYLDSWAPDWPACQWSAPIDRVRPFVDWCATRGLYVELTLLCDCDDFQATDADQVARVAALLEAIAGAPNVFAEICNEPSENGCDPVAIADALDLWDARLRPCPMALGLYPITGDEPGFRVLDYVGDHPPRKPDWPMESGKIGHYQYEQTRAVCLCDEPPKCSEPGADPEATEQAWETSPDHFEDAGGGYGIGAAGATFHCRSGIDTVEPGPLETTCAERFFDAMRLFPADSFTARYEHDGTAGHPLEAINDPTIIAEVASRVFAEVGFAVGALPTAAWAPLAASGWQLVARKGTRGTLMALARWHGTVPTSFNG